MWDDDDCSDHLDPINVIFHGTSGVAGSVQRHADHHGGWDAHLSGVGTSIFGIEVGIDSSKHYFSDHGECQPQDRESATNAGVSVSGDIPGYPRARYHMRYNEGDIGGALDIDSGLGFYSVAAAHWEDVVGCPMDLPWPLGSIDIPSHVVPSQGFNQARDEIYIKWSLEGGHATDDWRYYGNIELQQQCDGTLSSSDG